MKYSIEKLVRIEIKWQNPAIALKQSSAFEDWMKDNMIFPSYITGAHPTIYLEYFPVQYEPQIREYLASIEEE